LSFHFFVTDKTFYRSHSGTFSYVKNVNAPRPRRFAADAKPPPHEQSLLRGVETTTRALWVRRWRSLSRETVGIFVESGGGEAGGFCAGTERAPGAEAAARGVAFATTTLVS